MQNEFTTTTTGTIDIIDNIIWNSGLVTEAFCDSY